MRVLLICSNRERSPFPVAPLGALCVTAAARAAGHEVDLLDLSFVRSPRRALTKALKQKDYQLAALSIRNLDNCSYTHPKSYVDETCEIAKTAVELSGLPLVAGGSGFSLAPRRWLEELGAQWGVAGEGERAFPALLDALESGADPGAIPGVLGAADGAAESAALAEPAVLDELPPPAHADCAYARFLKEGGFVSVQTKRGCPCKCIYCIYPQIEGRRYRLRAPAAVADELERVARERDARTFFFTDSVFNAPREHALEICEELVRRRLDARWMAYCNPVGFDAELAQALVAAGCVGVEFGLDAAVEKMLVNLAKPFDQQQIKSALAAAAAAKLPCALHLLFGGPGETLDDVRETQRFLDSCATPNAVFASLGFRVYAGTPLERRAREEGAIAAETDLFRPAFYLSPGLGADPVAALDGVARQRAEWTTPVDWAKPALRMTQQVINRLGIRPQWLNARNYGKYMRRAK